jgi:DNA-binding PadR family transcriptional regulator
MSVRHALLALLTEGPKFGFRLREEFEQRTGDVWPLNVGQVYTTLQRLERDGLVESASEEGDSPQKDYAITDEGLREVHEWLRTPPAAIPPRDDLVIKVLVAVGMPGVDLPEVLQSHRRRLVELMQTYTRLKEDTPDDVRVALVVDAEIFRLDALIRWVDSAHARVNAMPPAAVSQPATGKVTSETVAVKR